MANILANIIPDPDTGLYSSRVSGINGNEVYIDDYGWAYQTVLFYLADLLSPIDPSEALTGTVSVSSGATSVTGNNTIFTSELSIGKKIKIGTQVFKVVSVVSDTNIQIDNAHTSGASGVTAYINLKTESDYENKLSHWSNFFVIPPTTFNPGIDRRGWVFHADTGWTWLAPQVFEQQQYAPFWLWFGGLSLGTSSQWCYFDRSFIGQHWSFEKQYINPIPTNTSEKIYDTASGIDIVEPGKLEGFGVYLWVHEKQQFRSFIKNSENRIFMSNSDIKTTPGTINYINVN